MRLLARSLATADLDEARRDRQASTVVTLSVGCSGSMAAPVTSSPSTSGHSVMLSRALASQSLVVNSDQFAEAQSVVMRHRLNSPLVLGRCFAAGVLRRPEHRVRDLILHRVIGVPDLQQFARYLGEAQRRIAARSRMRFPSAQSSRSFRYPPRPGYTSACDEAHDPLGARAWAITAAIAGRQSARRPPSSAATQSAIRTRRREHIARPPAPDVGRLAGRLR